MSNIVIVLSDQKIEVPVLGELHKLLGGSLAQLKSAIVDNKPVLEFELFDNYEEKSALLRNIIGVIQRNNLNTNVFEIPSDQTYETSSSLKESLISLEILENILNSADEEMDRQLNM